MAWNTAEERLLTEGQMRDYILRIHEMARCNFIQSDTEM